VISNQARFRSEQITFAGNSKLWVRKAESGNAGARALCYRLSASRNAPTYSKIECAVCACNGWLSKSET
jgi:hypothetical protein